MDFDKIKAILLQLNINSSAAGEHVAEVERHIRLLKDRCRGILSTLPFKQVPNIILIHLLQFIMMWLNAFPIKNGVLAQPSPQELIYVHKLDTGKHHQTLFGMNCEVLKEPEIANTLMPTTHEAIAMGPAGNLQGSYKFLCLETGRKIVRLTESLMPGHIIEKVNKMGTGDGNQSIKFLNRHKTARYRRNRWWRERKYSANIWCGWNY